MREGQATVEFRCPKCRGLKWGTVGHDGVNFGRCRNRLDGIDCRFEWLRADDWLVFVDSKTGRRFASRDEYERLA